MSIDSSVSHAQVEQTIPKPSDTPPLPSVPPSQPKPQLQVPPTPTIPESTPSGDRFLIKQINVRGNTVLQTETAALTKPYQNREITFEDLLELRSQIVQLYVKNSYITSGAFLPNNQDLSSGIVTI